MPPASSWGKVQCKRRATTCSLRKVEVQQLLARDASRDSQGRGDCPTAVGGSLLIPGGASASSFPASIDPLNGRGLPRFKWPGELVDGMFAVPALHRSDDGEWRVEQGRWRLITARFVWP